MLPWVSVTLWSVSRIQTSYRSYSLGIAWSVLGVVPNLGTVWALDGDVGGLVGAELLAVGTDPLLGWGLLVDLVELLLGWSGLVGGFGGGCGEDVSADDTKVGEDLSELGVCDEQGDQDSQVSGGCKVNSVPRWIYSPWSTSFLASALETGTTPFCLARDGSPA